MDAHRLEAHGDSATLARRGAELQALRLGGRDLLWSGGPLWPKHAPLLFPVVGSLEGGALRLGGAVHRMPKHGFGRDLDWTWTLRGPDRCALELTDSPASRAAYPFAFRLRVAFALTGEGLRMDLALHNPGEGPLPASLGLHPAFPWPLAPGLPKAAHRLVFEADEPGALHRVDGDGLLDPAPRPTPIRDRVLALDEALFEEDALIFLAPRSRRLRYDVPGGPGLSLAWDGFPHLGVWAKPDRVDSFLCLEPWSGYADPAGWRGDFREKPGSFEVAPGDTRCWSMTVSG